MYCLVKTGPKNSNPFGSYTADRRTDGQEENIKQPRRLLNNRRITWPKGKVRQVYPGRDGQIRTADVTTSFGTYRRSVSKLAKLDVKKDDEI